MSGLTDLIEALTILRKYDDPALPTHCEHDVLTICVSPEGVSEDDLARLEELHVTPGGEYDDDCFTSYFFGSA